MAFPRNSIRAFLGHAKRSLQLAAQEDRKLSIVVGNESADLDSLTSSILYAYLRSIATPRTASSPLYVPLLNIPESGLRLRPEFTAVCRYANITPSHLITLDDLPKAFRRPQNVQWILVDHNKLQGDLGERYSQQVHGVIDHHDEENAVPQDTEPEPRVIEKCGSCTSLVTRYCKSMWDNISSYSLASGAGHAQGEFATDDIVVTQGWDAQIAKMALASTLIDTANLTAWCKVEQADTDAVKYLEAKILLSTKDARAWDRSQFYNEIDKAKQDIAELTLREILSKDYKQWTENGMNLGISSVVKPIQFLVERAESETGDGNLQETDILKDNIQKFMDELKLSIHAIMTTSDSKDGAFQRQLLLHVKDSAASYASKFVERATPELQLERTEVRGLSEEDGHWPATWLQKDVSKSRKQVAPLLREMMRI